MRNRFVRTADYPADGLLQKAGRHFSKLSRLYGESGARECAPMALAILSVPFQQYPSWLIPTTGKAAVYGEWLLHLSAAGLVLASVLALSARTSRLAVAIFIVIAAIVLLPDWRLLANHSYLALWTIPAAIIFKEWWRSDLYAFYLRVTLGIIMIAAFFQKILAGTYIDGSYLTWLATHGRPTQSMFSILCDSASAEPCRYYQFISIFILAWQLAVGILLLLGLNSLIFLAIEVGFLLGAGVFADEMNFQVLNIALLCIVFRYGMPLWLLAINVAFLIVDLRGINDLLQVVLNHVA
jgi:hypothetical protein